MNPVILTLIIVAYFILILIVSYVTGKNASNKTFFTGDRKSKWYLVSFGMIGASLSGVTFISVPDWVQTSQFAYIQMVLGYLVGYMIIARILLPVYYKLQLTSIYTYLDERFGRASYKTGAWCFLISRTIGASFRLFLVANVLQWTIGKYFHLPYFITVAITILLIWLYTFKGGIRTVVYTDVLQTLFMLIAVALTIFFIARQLQLSFGGIVETVKESHLSRVFFFDNFKGNPNHFLKQFISGVLIAVSMTGLDQDMMQKNLTCRNLKEAQKNVYWYGFSFLPMNIIFLSLGVLLFIYAQVNQIVIPETADTLYPVIATGGTLPSVVTILFMLGLIAAAYSSADSALTALTTSVTIDILDGNRLDDARLKKLRIRVHVIVSIVLLLIILIFKAVNNENVVSALFKAAGYTYGPILGIFTFGLFTKWKIRDQYIFIIALVAPGLTYIFNKYSEFLFSGYIFSFEILLMNGVLTFLGLMLLIRRK